MTLLLGMLITIIAIAAGCGQKSGDPETGGKPEAQQHAEQTLHIQAYYTDDQILNLVQEKKDIKFADEKAKYLEALKALQSTDDAKLVKLWQENEFQSAILKDGGALIIDVKIPAEAHLGASGEDLAIQAVLKTVFQFEEVQSVDILVDGQSVDSLMGHVELEHPYTRKSIM
ncbi:hypothetical protein BVG16_31615 [Paenibacillus selenitireducens]|uniref:GerMN domain-containing protein n=1 Tax=Paenibacillus selenitireducens TaxID=1324314 RepID=A0A1T2WZG6_9BACL|nr:GerMN domain-containing protein [Paenibacillus selenitireducens]OPA72866.1 hypothetical protein BVG16_31615 [Paenibacillus selenitireducens]